MDPPRHAYSYREAQCEVRTQLHRFGDHGRDRHGRQTGLGLGVLIALLALASPAAADVSGGGARVWRIVGRKRLIAPAAG